MLKDSVTEICPICLSLKYIDVFLACTFGDFFECTQCDFIFFTRNAAAGSSIESATNYQDLYWAEELLAAKKSCIWSVNCKGSRSFHIS